jgi:hypothetical protein
MQLNQPSLAMISSYIMVGSAVNQSARVLPLVSVIGDALIFHGPLPVPALTNIVFIGLKRGKTTQIFRKQKMPLFSLNNLAQLYFAGFVRQKRGKTLPSFIKQRW